MKLSKHIIVLLLLVFTQNSYSEDYFGVFEISREPKVFFLHKDTNNLKISCEYFNYKNLPVEFFELDSTRLYISSLNDTFDMELSIKYKKPRYYGGGSINGFGSFFSIYLIDKEIQNDKELYIGKFVCRKLQDTIYFNQDSVSKDLFCISENDTTSLHIINKKLVYSGTGLRIQTKYRLKKPWQLIISKNQQRNIYYRK